MLLLAPAMQHRSLALSSILVFALACESPSEPPAVGNGEIQNGTFTYACVSEADAFCAPPRTGALVPTAIALGTTFRLSFTDANGAPAPLDLLGTTQLTLTPDGTLHADKPGYASVFARNASGEVDDYYHLRIVTPATLHVIGVDPSTTLQPGDARSVYAQPLDGAGVVLAGTGTYDWETSAPSVVSIETSALGYAALRAEGPGLARIRVVFGGATSTVDVLVGER